MITVNNVRVGAAPGTTTMRVGAPYADEVSLRSGLGSVQLRPEINRTVAAVKRWFKAPMPDMTDQYQRGESGYYYDSPLGAVPTDFELAKDREYLPVQSGWVLGGANGLAIESLADAIPPTASAPLSKYQKLAIGLSVVSTLAIVANASFNILKNYRR